jgi:16S rRNA (cytidine1402-2'-O)-methyltransferase
MSNDIPGTLTIAAVPIGCLDDASPRLAAALGQAQIIAAEDTRRLLRLASRLGVPLTARIVSYWDVGEQSRAAELAGELAAGRDVLLVTDAGMPAVSDPGYRLVQAAAAAGARVTALPGPSAAITALAVSGLPSDRFCFEGFLPPKGGKRSRRLTDLAAEPRTMIFFESPRRLAATLADLAVALGGQRRAVACRELTKTHEEIRRGTLDELAAWAGEGVRGEVTVVVAGAARPDAQAGSADLAAAAGEVAAMMAAGASRKNAAATVAAGLGLSTRAVYRASLPGSAGGDTAAGRHAARPAELCLQARHSQSAQRST